MSPCSEVNSKFANCLVDGFKAGVPKLGPCPKPQISPGLHKRRRPAAESRRTPKKWDKGSDDTDGKYLTMWKVLSYTREVNRQH